MEIPVYLFTGFLESGKTKFVQETLEDANFNNGENILLLVCEEGIEEYDDSRFASPNVSIVTLEDKSELTRENLEAITEKSGCERIIVEYNGMWNLDDFYRALPSGWLVYQEMFFADANTFINYNNNMRGLVVDKLKSCEMCVFNRAKADFDKLMVHKIVRSVSRKADIAYEYADGSVEYDNIEDPLPFDKNASVIEINDDDFGLWYRDFAENTKDYIGKTVKAKFMCARNKIINSKNELVVGRRIMTCCEDDIEYKGLLCKCEGAHDFAAGSWVLLTAQISFKKHRVYKDTEGPLLTALEISQCDAPENQVCSFI